MSDDRIISKIRAMLAKAAEGSGATEDEAATALAMAMAMMAKHGIERSQLDEEDEESPEHGKWSDYQFLKWHVYTAQAASYLYHCKVVQISGKKYSLSFVGKPSYIQACEMTFDWLNQQVERLYKEALPPGLDKATRAELRRTFKMACALRVRARAWAIAQAMATDDALAIEMTGSTALVVKNHMEKEKEQLETFYKTLGYVPAIQRRSKAGIGTQLGFQAGDRVQLQKQVSEKRLMIGKD